MSYLPSSKPFGSLQVRNSLQHTWLSIQTSLQVSSALSPVSRKIQPNVGGVFVGR